MRSPPPRRPRPHSEAPRAAPAPERSAGGGVAASAARHRRSASLPTPLLERSRWARAALRRSPAARPSAPASLIPLYPSLSRCSLSFVLSASPSSLAPRSSSPFHSRSSEARGQSAAPSAAPSARAPRGPTPFHARDSSERRRLEESLLPPPPSAAATALAPSSVSRLCARSSEESEAGRAARSGATPLSPSRVSARSSDSRAVSAPSVLASRSTASLLPRSWPRRPSRLRPPPTALSFSPRSERRAAAPSTQSAGGGLAACSDGRSVQSSRSAVHPA